MSLFRKPAVALTVVALAAFGVSGVAMAATSTSKSSKKSAKKTKKKATTRSASGASGAAGDVGTAPDGDRHGSGETALTGTTLEQASAAALAAAPGTVERASNERAGDSSGAAYEVHVKKTDGTRVEVLLDSSYKVIATNADHGGRGGPDGHHGGPNTDPAHEAAESAAQAADELTWQKAA